MRGVVSPPSTHPAYVSWQRQRESVEVFDLEIRVATDLALDRVDCLPHVYILNDRRFFNVMFRVGNLLLLLMVPILLRFNHFNRPSYFNFIVQSVEESSEKLLCIVLLMSGEVRHELVDCFL